MSPDCRKKRNTWLRGRLLAIHQPSRVFRNRSKSLLWPDLCVLPLPSSSLLQTSWLLIVSQTPSETLQPDGPSSWTAPPFTHASRAPPFLQIFHQVLYLPWSLPRIANSETIPALLNPPSSLFLLAWVTLTHQRSAVLCEKQSVRSSRPVMVHSRV